MFEMEPEMDFGERLSLWWSCYWRQVLFLAGLGLFIGAGVLVFGHPSSWRARAGFPHSPEFLGDLAGLLVLAFLLAVPLIGEAARRGFIAQQLAAPARFEIGSIVMIGLTTFGWGILASIPVSAAMVPLHALHIPLLFALANLALHILASMYIVLPRQARRLRLQCGFDE